MLNNQHSCSRGVLPEVPQIWGSLQEIGLLLPSVICIIPIYSLPKLTTSLTPKSCFQNQGWIKIHHGPSPSTYVAPNVSKLCLGSSVRCFAKCEGKLAAVAALCTTCHGWWRCDIFAWGRLSTKLISWLKPQKEVFRRILGTSGCFNPFLPWSPWRLAENWTIEFVWATNHGITRTKQRKHINHDCKLETADKFKRS